MALQDREVLERLVKIETSLGVILSTLQEYKDLIRIDSDKLIEHEKRLIPLETKIKIGSWVVTIVVGGLITLGLKGCI